MNSQILQGKWGNPNPSERGELYETSLNLKASKPIETNCSDSSNNRDNCT